MTAEKATHSVRDLKQSLEKVRQESVIATRRGDYRTVARLTSEAARINEQINDRATSG